MLNHSLEDRSHYSASFNQTLIYGLLVFPITAYFSVAYCKIMDVLIMQFETENSPAVHCDPLNELLMVHLFLFTV